MDLFKDSVIIVGSELSWVLISLTLFLFIVYFLRRRDLIHILFIILSVCSAIYSAFIKSLFKLERPLGYSLEKNGILTIPWEKLFSSEIYGFPSTHTVIYTAFFGYLIYLSYNLRGFDRALKNITRVFSMFMIIFVGASRVLLGAHYVKDVIAGYFFGLTFLGFLIKGEKFLEQKLLNTRTMRKKP